MNLRISEFRNVINVWISYASYYFGRVNLSLIIPLLITLQGFSKYDVGIISSLFLVSYALGQYFHGHFSEKFNPYIYMGIGLLLSSILNLFMGFFGSFFIFLAIGEFFDGYVQSMGWSSAVRSVSESTKKQSFWSCFIGTSYQVGNSIAWLIISITISILGWRSGFWMASFVMAAAAINILLKSDKLHSYKQKNVSFKHQIFKTLTIDILLAGLSLGLINIIRYGIIIWIPLYLFEVFDISVGSIGLKIFLIPIMGILGTLFYNLFDKKRELTTIIYLVILSFLLFNFTSLSETASFIMLIFIGFFMYGPHVFFVSTFPSRFLKEGKVASATGLIDAIGYLGAVLVGIITPFLIDSGGWNRAFVFFASCSVGALLLTVILLLQINYQMKHHPQK